MAPTRKPAPAAPPDSSESSPGIQEEDHNGITTTSRNPPAPSPSTPNDSDHDNINAALGLSRSSTIVPADRSTNYLPSKFSSAMLVPTAHRRKGAKAKTPKDSGPTHRLRKALGGGGREVFRRDEPRMPVEGDEDYDGVQGGIFGGRENEKEGGKTPPRLRWNGFKWALFIANTLLSAYALTGLIFCLLTWFDVFEHADIVRVGNTTALIISTTTCVLALLVCTIGWAGILLNNRAFLAWYAFLLWAVFALLVSAGYITYKQRAFNVEGKVNAQWSRALRQDGRLRIQNRLRCCGYYSPFVEAAPSQTCFPRAVLQGCKQPYLHFERAVLELWYIIAFSLVPLQIGVMVTALLCADHVTWRFGKGMMPAAYRLTSGSVAVIMGGYASRLADQYGADSAGAEGSLSAPSRTDSSASSSSSSIAGASSRAMSSRVSITPGSRFAEEI
ncbi:hypothetical protein BJ138DRAFT_1094449 [Hygrophoropsis aurantiaca]|uniref:Uncharacterized protein n=1 Tax=Hygrophoropsis aurantiaca TaxID=72124 RepID=A0ACB7ZYJ7_9AGAM|nr:hypothetical protein BJ138DRAFT_1094449 [Hygrophoropsis aurantiaca]